MDYHQKQIEIAEQTNATLGGTTHTRTEQTRTYIGKKVNGDTVVAHVHYGDEHGDGRNSLSITGEVWVKRARVGNSLEHGLVSCGIIHDDIASALPELVPYLPYHMCSTIGPMHYFSNTLYHVSDGEGKTRELGHARVTAIWPDATDEELTSPDLAQKLEQRLPQVIRGFHNVITSLGFTY